MTNSKRRSITAAEAKAHFAESLRVVERGDVLVITRHGKPIAALVSASELVQLERLRSRPPSDGLAKLAGHWHDSEELAEELDLIDRAGDVRKPLPEMN